MENTIISQIRGDTKGYKFQRIDSNGSVIMTPPDKLYFTVKKTYESQEMLIQKRLPDFEIDSQGFYHFVILPTETNDLQYGKYVFDIEVIVEGVKTTVARGDFILESEVTFADDED